MALVSKTAEFYSGFDPRMIPGCILWLDGNDSQTITGTTQVTQWNDKTSNGYNFTRKYAGYPAVSNLTYSGLNGVYFGSNAALVNSNIPVPTNYSMFAVANRPGSNGSYGYIAKIHATTDWFGFFGVQNVQNAFATFGGTNATWRDVNSNAPKKVINEIPVLVNYDVCGAVLTPYWNGEAMTTKTGSVNAATGIVLGDTHVAGQPWLGTIGEILLFSNTLSTAQRQQVEGYLMWKWKLQRKEPISTWATGTNPTTFNPNSVTGIALWLDAADRSTITLSGSNVTGWTDKSTTPKTVTFRGPVGASNPTYDSLARAVVTNNTSFTAANVDTRKSTTTYLNVFIVYQWLGGGSNAQASNVALWGADSGGGFNRLQLLGGAPGGLIDVAYGFFRGSSSPNQIPTTGLESTNQLIYSCRYASNISTGGGMFVRVNGQKATQGTYTEAAPSTQTSQTSIGFSTLDEANTYPGRISFNEILVYRADMSDSTRLDIESYLAYKWNIPWFTQVDSRHPFFNDPVFHRPLLPPDVGTAEFWYDAADNTTITSTGTTFTSAGNKGTTQGSNLVVSTGTPTIGVATQNNLPCIAMPTSNDSLVFVGAFPNQPRTRFFAMRPRVTTGTGVSLFWLFQNLLDSSGYEAQLFNAAQLDVNANGIANNILASPIPNQSNLFGVWTIRNAATAANNRVASNGNAQTLVSSSPAASYFTGSASNYINRRQVGSNYTGALDLAELISYNSELSSNQTEQVEGYLAWKWGTQASLPVTHPFKPYYPLVTQFTPGQASGLALWLDATDSATFDMSGTSVQRWRDKSGAGLYSFSASRYDASAIGVCTISNDIFGKDRNAVRFTGSNGFIGNTSITGTGFTGFAVFSTDISSQGVSGARVLSISTPGVTDAGSVQRAVAIQLPSTTSNLVSTFRNSTNIAGALSRANSPMIVESLYDGINGYIYLDGSMGTLSGPTASTGSFASTVYGVGIDGGRTTSAFLTGYIGEVLMYSNALTTSDRYEVEGYLAWKWNLQSRLPSWHPYKYLNP